MSMNRVELTGNLTRDPEIRTTAAGMPVMTIGVAVNDRRKNAQTGEWEDYPNFIDCTMFGARAESVAKYIGKGSKVAVCGKFRWSQWEAQDGSKRSKIEVIIEDIDFMSRNGNGAETAYADEKVRLRDAPEVGQQPMSIYDNSLYDEDIAF